MNIHAYPELDLMLVMLAKEMKCVTNELINYESIYISYLNHSYQMQTTDLRKSDKQFVQNAERETKAWEIPTTNQVNSDN